MRGSLLLAFLILSPSVSLVASFVFSPHVNHHQIQPLKEGLRGAKDDNSIQQEFDIDDIICIAGLNELSRSIGGPKFNEQTSCLESAKDQLWDFVEDTAEDDVDEMCMGQLTVIMMELGGEDFGEGTTLGEARNAVWNLANSY